MRLSSTDVVNVKDFKFDKRERNVWKITVGTRSNRINLITFDKQTNEPIESADSIFRQDPSRIR